MFHRALIGRSHTATSLLRTLRQTSRRYATDSKPSDPASRISRIESRLPRFLSRIVTPLRAAPLSHISAFLILHEITAVVPIFGLTTYFHYYNWLPPYISEWKWVSEYTVKLGNYLRKRGWINEEKRSGRWFGRGETGTRIVVELATAWAITKALLPLRLVISVWGTPWFARWFVLPITGRFSRLLKGRSAAATASQVGMKTPGAGTNAVGGNVLPKEVPLK